MRHDLMGVSLHLLCSLGTFNGGADKAITFFRIALNLGEVFILGCNGLDDRLCLTVKLEAFSGCSI